MITEYIRYSIDPAQAPAFEADYAAAAESLAASPYCIDYELSRGVADPTSFILQIHWTSAADHPARFRASADFRSFFGHIGRYVDRIVEMSHYRAGAVVGTGRGTDPDTPSLYQWAGGAAALDRLFEAFYAHVADDELIGPLFAGMDPDHPHHVALWLGEVFGGPRRYTEELTGYPRMLQRHLGLTITAAQRRRWVSLLLETADEVGLPDDPEFRAAFAGYLEWGSRIAMANSAPGADPPPDAVLPKWGWGVAPPWTG